MGDGPHKLTCIILKDLLDLTCTWSIASLWDLPNWHALQKLSIFLDLSDLLIVDSIEECGLTMSQGSTNLSFVA